MKKVLYDIEGYEGKSTVLETKRQKDILDVLEELVENAVLYGWDSMFENLSFYIEYTDGKTYEASECGEYGVYKKRGISRIIYVNESDTQVYGRYSVNEYGNVF